MATRLGLRGAVRRGRARVAPDSLPPVKVGIVVPFSWSFWGAVVEHAELQAAALEELGHDVRLIMGNDRRASSRAPCTRGWQARRPAGDRHRGGALGDRPGERLAAEHRPLTAHVLPAPPDARTRALRRAPPARADDPRDLRVRSCSRGRRSSRRSTRPARSGGCVSGRRSGGSCWTASTIGSPSRSARACRRSGGCRASTR